MDDRACLLQQIFENVNNWLHFAEAKNAALIAFNIALLAVIVESNWAEAYILLFSIIVIGLLLSTIFAILSFKPINKILEKVDNINLEENLLHFAYIASLEQEEYIRKLYDHYWGESNKDVNNVPKLEIDYCHEIIANSRITIRKQRYFRYSFYIIVFVIIAIAVLVICA